MEKRRCLGVSSCTGGDSGRLGGSVATLDMAPSCDMVGEGLSFGGVTGGAGTRGAAAAVAVAVIAAIAASAEMEERDCCELVSSRLSFGGPDWAAACLAAVVEVVVPEPEPEPKPFTPCWEPDDEGGAETWLCLRMSDSLAITPRFRRNGMAGGLVGRRRDHEFIVSDRHSGFLRLWACLICIYWIIGRITGCLVGCL